MSSNGSTKQFLNDNSPTGSPRHPRVIPPEIRVYPSIHQSVEPSRYEPNFMLGYGAPTYPRYPIETARNHGNEREKRQMKRPKAYDKSMLDPRLFLHPPTPELPRTFGYGSVGKGTAAGDFGGGPKGSYDWHIPRASLWCYHRGYGAEPCKDCQWKHNERGIDIGKDTTGGGGGADGASICSSINPPPTFTALDNYRPVRPRRPKCRHCSCGIIFAITTVFSLLVLVLIAAFIIYVEMVLKHQTASAMDRM